MRKLSTLSLEVVVWIARLGSFTAAAERMHTTQPAISARVKVLEEALGHRLFVRQGRGVQVTPEGRDFIHRAESIIAQIDDLSVSFGTSRAQGVVRLGTSSICLDLVSATGIELTRRMPGVTMQLAIDRAAPLLDLLESRKLDAAIVSGPIEAHKFRSRRLGFDRMLWVAAPSLLDSRAHLPAEVRLQDVPVWSVPQDSFYWSAATAGLPAQGARLDRVNETGTTLAVARIVAGGAGIGLIAESMATAEFAQGRLAPVPGLAPCQSVEFSIAVRRDLVSPIVDELMGIAVAASRFSQEPL
jgi:DNA-binding transcriptional LysR family regulator